MTTNETTEARWTAYALGELDEQSAREVEAELAHNAAAKRHVDDTRRAAELLSASMQREPKVELTDKQRQAIDAAVAPPPARRLRIWQRALIAASVATLLASVVHVVILDQMPVRYSARQSKDHSGIRGSHPGMVIGSAGDKKQWYVDGKLVADGDVRMGRRDDLQASAKPAELEGAQITPSTAPVTLGVDANAGSARELKRHRLGEANNDPATFPNAWPRLAAERVEKESAGPTDTSGFKLPRSKVEYSGHISTPSFTYALKLSDKDSAKPYGIDSLEGQNRPEGLTIITDHNGRIVAPVIPGQIVIQHNTEAYDHITDNAFLGVVDNPLSTFSIDVDTASYANVRRFIMQQKQLPPKGAVRIEEFINYFDYAYSAPAPGNDPDAAPFAAHVEVNACPWNPAHRLVKIGLKGREIAKADRPASNLVFLIDVSGSMMPANKLPLVKQGLRMLVDQLDERDRVAMVVYAGSTGLVLDSTPVVNKNVIVEAIDRLTSGGSTNGGAGIQLAYDVAVKNLVKDGTNRVILCTDGDFNVGVTDRGSLANLIEEKRKTGVFLSILGFGMGNVKDATMEDLSNKGNGNYAYVDSADEARKVFVEDMLGTLVTIAKDVKIQVEFNPAHVQSYRLIGYENRVMAKEHFNDDTKDAGEIGAGHTVTALYEVTPAGKVGDDVRPAVDPLKYQTPVNLTNAADSGEMLTLKLRYKQPDSDTSSLIEFPVKDQGKAIDESSDDFRFAAAVASFGMILRDSPHKGDTSFEKVLDIAQGALGNDARGYRSQFVEIVTAAKAMAGAKAE